MIKGRSHQTALRVFAALTILLTAAVANADHVLITRSFSGIWEQPDHESQGLVLQINETDGEKTAAAYWFSYDENLMPTWYLGIGPVEGHSIPMTLYLASGTGFLDEEGDPAATVEEIGTLLLDFHNCNQGDAVFDTPEEYLGGGSFRIKRLTSIYRMRCSGGISDDTNPGAKPVKLDLDLLPHPDRDDVSGSGKAKFWERSDRSDFMVNVEGLVDGLYSLEVCEDPDPVAEFEVIDGEGHVAFRSPQMGNKLLLDFDPRGCLIEVIDEVGVALTSGDAVLAEHASDSPGPGEAIGDETEIEVEFSNLGVLPEAKGSASWQMDGENATFLINLLKVPYGIYTVMVDNVERGQIEVVEQPGQPRGQIKFKEGGDPDLNFDPRGKWVEILDADDVIILEALFPES